MRLISAPFPKGEGSTLTREISEQGSTTDHLFPFESRTENEEHVVDVVSKLSDLGIRTSVTGKREESRINLEKSPLERLHLLWGRVWDKIFSRG